MLDTSKIEPVTQVLNDLGSALLSATSRYGSRIAEACDRCENYSYPQNSDLLDFVRLLLEPESAGTSAPRVPDAAVQNAAARVRLAISASIVKNVRGQLHPNTQGLAIFLPTPGGFLRTDADQAGGFGQRYSALSFSKAAPNWQVFLVGGPP